MKSYMHRYKKERQSKRLWRVALLFAVLSLVGAIVIFAASYNFGDNIYITYDSNNWHENNDYQIGDSYTDNLYYNSGDISDYHSYIQYESNFYDDENEIYQSDYIYYHYDGYTYGYEWEYSEDFSLHSYYMGIMPLSAFGGPYPNIPNYQLRIQRGGVPWPAPDTPIMMLVPPTDTGVSLSGRFPHERSGLPIMAGYTTQTWGGTRNAGPGGSFVQTNMAPAAVPGLLTGAGFGPSGTLPTTSWLAHNAPDATHIPMHITLGVSTAGAAISPNASGQNTINFIPVQLYMPDVNLNYDNHQAAANTPNPPVHMTRAVVGEYAIANFATFGIVNNITPMYIASIQLMLQTNDIFQFIPAGNVAGTSNHVTTPFLTPSSQAGGRVNIPIVPVSGLGVGTHTDTVTSYQRGYEYRFANGEFYWVWHNSWPLGEISGINNKHEFEISFTVTRPAIAVDIPSASGSGRTSTVYVRYAYGSATPSQHPIPYNNNTFNYTANQPNNGDIQVTIPPPRYTFFHYDAQGRPICYDTGTPLPISPPPGFAVIDTTVNGDGDLEVLLRPLHTITFHLRGGYISPAHTDPVIRINRLQGTQIQLGDGNALTGHPVTAYPLFNTAAMPQRGVPWPNPTRINSVFQGWREVNSAGQALVPNSAPLSSLQVAALVVTGNRYFEAVYSFYLVFYKTDLYITYNPQDPEFSRNPLEDAEFELRLQDGTVLYTTTPTGTDGRVVIGGVSPQPPSLLLPSVSPGISTVQFILVETEVPDGFQQPIGHWVITVNLATGDILSITSQSGNPDFVWRPLPEPPQMLSTNLPDGGLIGDAPHAIMGEPDCDCHRTAAAMREISGLSGIAPQYIQVVPLGPEVEHAVISHPSQLTAALINSIPQDGVPHIIRFNFPANVAVTTDSQIPQINIPTGNRHIVLESYNGVNQVWNRDQIAATGRHFVVGHSATLELRNVTLSRSPEWVVNNPTVVSGGVSVSGNAVLYMSHPNATISNNRAGQGGAVIVSSTGSFIMSEGNIINNVATATGNTGGGGGIFADGTWSPSPTIINVEGGRVSGNRSYGFGGGIGVCCSVTIIIGENGQVYSNHAQMGGGGINSGGWGLNSLTLNGGSIHSNHANSNGGGVHGCVDSRISTITINSGSITMNTANQNGGGIYLPLANNTVVMHEGSITRNWAGNAGGGMFVHHNNNQLISNVTINSDFVFGQNVAETGMRVNHVMAALNPLIEPDSVTVIPTGHAFTNHDINAEGPEYGWHAPNRPRDPDWIRLNDAIHHPSNFTTIIIHPYGSGQIEGPGSGGSGIFNLVVYDPNPNVTYRYRTITTVPINGAPTANPHSISITRAVTIRAADGHNIILRMPVPNSTNTAAEPRWATTQTNLGRHFIVSGDTSNLILGGGTGTIRLDGNAIANLDGNRGGIIVQQDGQLGMLAGSVIYNCRALIGGGVHVSGGAVFNMSGATAQIIDNIATGIGPTGAGGVFIIGDDSRLNMTGGTIAYNTAFNGGGVHVLGGAEFYMNGGTIRNNQAIVEPIAGQGAGGVRVGYDGIFNMHGNSVIRHNTSAESGGAGVRIENDGIFTMHNGTISYNRAGTNGGGVFVNGGTFFMNNGTITRNTAATHGGGVDTIANTTSEIRGGNIHDNRAPRGAGISVRNASLSMTGGNVYNHRFSNTNAEGVGTGNITEGAGVWVGHNNVTYFTMTDGVIGHTNNAYGNRADRGGGVFVGDGATFTMSEGGTALDLTSGTIIGNLATNGGDDYPGGALTNNGGGGVFITGLGTLFTMYEGLIHQNQTGVIGGTGWSGGGIGVINQSRFYMHGGEISENIANLSGGGGVSIHYSATFTMTDGLIRENNSIGGGGVLAYNRGNFVMEGGIIEENTITSRTGFPLGGGGVAIFAYSTFHMNGGIIRNHNVNYDGGGVWVGPSPNNTIFAQGPSSFLMTEGHIYANEALRGGGVFITGTGTNLAMRSEFTMQGGMIGGIPTASWPFVANQAYTFPFANVAPDGGGVTVMDNASFVMEQGDDDGTPTQGTIAGNVATASGGQRGGGGVWVSGAGSTFDIYHGLITRNTAEGTNASDGGGGVLVRGTGSFNMRGGFVRDNVATYGAGVAAEGSQTFFHMHAGTIEDNNARSNGGGVHVQNYANFYLHGLAEKTITANEAIFGGGVWVADISHMTMAAGADNLEISHNIAAQRGGGIYTQDAEYGDPLTRITVADMAFGNLTLFNVDFNNNRAGHREFSPANALVVMASAAWSSLSADIHPINNYDINYIGAGFILPLTGGTGMMTFAASGTILLAIAAAMIIGIKMHRNKFKSAGITRGGVTYHYKKL